MPDYAYLRPEHYYFGGGGDTFATPLSIILMLAVAVLILLLPRRYVFVVYLLAALLIPLSVSIVAGGFHFNSNRLLLIVGWLRVMWRRERYPRRLSAMDKAVIYGAIVNSIAYVLLWRELGALIVRLGILFSCIGAYLLLRSWVRTKGDVLRLIRTLVVLVAFLAPPMLYERATGYNAYSLLGAERINTTVRKGAVRAKGPFRASIIPGTLAATVVPLFLGLWWYSGAKIVPAMGIVGSALVMFGANSSTPFMSLAAAVVGLAAWRLRKNMRSVRWWIVIVILCAQVEMAIKSHVPVWFAIDRVSGFLGGSGYHRTMLIDNCVRHFFNWFLIGTKDNASWGWEMWDVDNAFLDAGIKGGLAGFILFLLIFVYGYRTIGAARKAAEGSWKNVSLIWAIGASFCATMTGFLGIIYYDQSAIAFYALLVMVQLTPLFSVTLEHPGRGRHDPAWAEAQEGPVTAVEE